MTVQLKMSSRIYNDEIYKYKVHQFDTLNWVNLKLWVQEDRVIWLSLLHLEML